MLYALYILLVAAFWTMPLTAFAAGSPNQGFVLWSGQAVTGNCVTTACHASLGTAKYVHLPVAEGDCTVCHLPTDKPHPGAGSMTLLEEEPGLCLQCHENPAAGMAYPHTAVKNGCTGCHSPHQGGGAKYLLQSGAKLCLLCHQDIKRGKYEHGPSRAGNCGMCHGVHGGEHESMLNRSGNDNCLSCHPNIRQIIENAVSQHEPVANGLCWDCHAPHASDYQPYLLNYYSPKFYTTYDPGKYALCFKCHDASTVEYERTSEATGFRNRDQNLHYFHVKRSKGRTCKSCHGVHGATQAKLLVREISGFGRWAIPLTWIGDGEQATCNVGCHRPKTYNRTKKVVNH